MGLLNTWDYLKHDSYYTNNKLESKHKQYNNKQHKQKSKQYKHNSKHNKHKNTWFSTPRKARIPGHANHVLKTQLWAYSKLLHPLSRACNILTLCFLHNVARNS